jgi:IMP dehydrogenase/GMP reductase
MPKGGGFIPPWLTRRALRLEPFGKRQHGEDIGEEGTLGRLIARRSVVAEPFSCRHTGEVTTTLSGSAPETAWSTRVNGAPIAFDYDDVSLVPRVVSTLTHRVDADPAVDFGPARLSLPIIGAPMPDVCGARMCQALAAAGAAGLLHRFQSIAAEVEGVGDAINADGAGPDAPRPGAAVGVSGDFRERFLALYEAGVRVFCLDTANGAHVQVETAIAWCRAEAQDVFLIAGNVASAEAFRWLEDQGADAVRVGIAGGSVCETRTETGVFVPTPYAVWECAQVKSHALVIGDSGVRSPSDFCKLLALGADAVMLGSALAGTREAPGRVIVVDGNKFKIMRGAASFSVQREHGGQQPEYVEGAETLVAYKGSVNDVTSRYRAGLRSSMSYMNARTLEEYRTNVNFVFHYSRPG